jgi:hypothetical protein
MRHIASVHVKQYKCEADVFIDEPSSGRRRLVVQYGDGYCGPGDLEKADNGRPQFITGIPEGMSEQELINTWLLTPMGAPYPRWEMPARLYGSPTLV